MQKIDPRISRTRETLHAAFMALLAEQDYESITVQHILERANINRSTFYKHYLNKDALAADLIERLKTDVLLPLLEQRFKTPTMEFAFKAAPIMDEHRKTLRLLWKIDGRRISLKREVLQSLKRKYIEAAEGRIAEDKADLAFQAHIFAVIMVAIAEQMILVSDKPLDPVATQANLQQALSHFILK